MVRNKYNNENAVPEIKLMTVPFVRGISAIALGAVLLTQNAFAAEADIEGIKHEIESTGLSPRPRLLRMEERRTLLTAEQESSVDSGVVVLEIPSSRADTLSARSIEGEEDDASSISSISVEVGTPPVMSPLLSPLSAGPRPVSASRSATRGALDHMEERATGHTRTRRASASGLLMPAEGGHAIGGGCILRALDDTRARILATDGGGYRGLFPAGMIWSIQREFEIDLPKSADLLAGTSAGGLNALGYATGMSAEAVVNFYRGHGSEIFSRGVWRKITAMGGLARAKYSRARVDDLLDAEFKDIRLSEVRPDVVIPALDVTTGQGIAFTSREAREDPRKNFKVSQVGASTSAAPTYYGVSEFEGPDGAHRFMADGGLFANNPSLAATAEISRMGYNPKRAIMVSLGTGEIDVGRDGAALRDAGAAGWGAGDLIKLMMASGQKFADDTARGIYGDGYLRLQALLDTDHGAMDDTSADQTAYLLDLAERTVEANRDRIEHIVRLWDGEAVPLDFDTMD